MFNGHYQGQSLGYLHATRVKMISPYLGSALHCFKVVLKKEF